jgi:hypothetical protein
MRIKIIALCVLLGVSAPASAQVSIGVDLPGVSLGFNLGNYPELTPIPGYPVYYAPEVDANLFFYDGLYWIYSQDAWYSSEWYNGPWEALSIHAVPFFLLRVPVRYYRRAPGYFRDWSYDAPPRWGERWGRDWERRHRDWDRWDRQAAPRRAPLPLYQREYAGKRYPHGDRQRELRNRHYDYQPRGDTSRREHRRSDNAPAPMRRDNGAEHGYRDRGDRRDYDREPPPAGRRDRSRDESQPITRSQPPTAPRQEGRARQPTNQGRSLDDRPSTAVPPYARSQQENQQRRQGRTGEQQDRTPPPAEPRRSASPAQAAEQRPQPSTRARRNERDRDRDNERGNRGPR